MTRVEIDLDVRVRGNLTYSGFEDVQGELPAEGHTVEVVEPESELVGQGRVVEIDEERRLVYLEVDWAGLRSGGQLLEQFRVPQGVYSVDFTTPTHLVAPGGVVRTAVNHGADLVPAGCP